MCTCLLAVQNFFWKNSSFIWMPTAERGTTHWDIWWGMCMFRVLMYKCTLTYITRDIFPLARQRLLHRVKVHLSLTLTEGTCRLSLQQTPAGQNGLKRQLHPASCMCQLIFLEGLPYACVYVILYKLHTCPQMPPTTFKIQFPMILHHISLLLPTWNPSHSSVCLPVAIPTGQGWYMEQYSLP